MAQLRSIFGVLAAFGLLVAGETALAQEAPTQEVPSAPQSVEPDTSGASVRFVMDR